ncbi:hypothetical protein VKT23_014724 [Stygiomarasmius scandens]|uniref:Uncharacterized protein n=1 Tax=Marasmiellus scandens TaxID=2682957 RepID=A0ABR1J2X9_9AGAR
MASEPSFLSSQPDIPSYSLLPEVTVHIEDILPSTSSSSSNSSQLRQSSSPNDNSAFRTDWQQTLRKMDRSLVETYEKRKEREMVHLLTQKLRRIQQEQEDEERSRRALQQLYERLGKMRLGIQEEMGKSQNIEMTDDNERS